MRIRLLVLSVLCCLGWVSLAQATYFHFENLRDEDVSFVSGGSRTWVFDLNKDSMGLWEIPTVPLTNQATDWFTTDPSYRGSGSMAQADVLHRAYLTMRFTGINDGKKDTDNETADLILDLSQEWTAVTLQQGGTGTIDVWSKLYEDHHLAVTIRSITGAFTVDWMNLAGCYETAPVPEPGTLSLLGLGLGAAALILRGRRRHA